MVAVAGLLASIVAVVPTPVTPTVRAVPSTVYVAALVPGTTSGSCSTPGFSPDAYPDGSREAIEAAITTAGRGGTVILCNGTHSLTSGDVTVGITDVTFQGESTANTIVDGGHLFRLFNADGHDVTFTGLTLSNGWVAGPGGAVVAQSVTVVGARFIGNMTASDGNGAAIFTYGSVDSRWTLYQNNTSGDNGGAMYVGGTLTSLHDTFDGNSAASRGGAVYGADIATLDFVQATGNTSPFSGGAIYGEHGVDSSGGTYEDNVVVEDWGGALYSYDGSITSLHDIFRRNYARLGGGAIYSEDGTIDSSSGIYEDNTSGTGSSGGAIHADSRSVTSSHDQFYRNFGAYAGGAIWAYGDVDSTHGIYMENTAHTYSGGAIYADVGGVTSDHDLFEGNAADNHGGAVYAGGDCDSSSGTYEDNHAAADGGAIYCAGAFMVSVDDVYRRNTADGSGGALNSYAIDVTGGTFEDNTATGAGGAIYSYGTTRIDRSTFARNTGDSYGGAVANDTDDPVYVTNSTFVANLVTNADTYGGGGLYGYGDVHVAYSTFVDNTAGGAGLGAAISAEYDVAFDHVLIVGDGTDGTDCEVVGDRVDDAGYSIETGWSCLMDNGTSAGALVNSDSTAGIARADLHLGSYAEHDASTWTYSLEPNSLAVDFDRAVDCAGGLTTDQRGVARPTGAGCDTGAYEYVEVAGPGAYIDDGSGTGTCEEYATIQEAVTAASDDDTIVACDGVHELDASVIVSKNRLTFVGESTAGTIVDGGDTLRLFDATGKDVTFVGLTLTNGKATTNGGGAVRGTNVTLIGVDATSNTADGNANPSGFGGAVFGEDSVSVLGGTYADNVGGGNGGAIATNGSLSITSGEFIGNSALLRGGGAVFSAVSATIVGGTFIENTANTYGGAVDANGVTLVGGLFQRNVTGFNAGFEPTWGGGAVFSYESAMTVTGTVFDANRSQGKPGGAISTRDEVGSVTIAGATFTDNSSATYGGAIYADSGVDITSSTFIANSSGDRGGAVYATGSVVTNGSDYSANTSGVSGGAVYATGSVVTNGSDYSANTSSANGGAIRAVGSIRSVGGSFVRNTALNGGALSSGARVDVTGGTFADNTAGDGGAINATGAVDLTAATFLRNTSLDDGGAIYVAGTSSLAARQTTFSGNSAGAEGGAIYLGGVASGGPISIDSSTFDANSADEGGAVYGGATVASVRNSTFYENTANTGDGGAFRVATVDVTNGTFVGNVAPNGSGDHVKAATLAADDTIFAEGDCSATTKSGTGSLDVDGACVGDLPTLGLNLGTFANWGGLTKTVSVLSPSDAINSSTPVAGACLSATDQRGTARPQGGGCDAGAYEVEGVVLAYTGPSVVYTSNPTANVTLSATIYPARPGCDLRFSVTDGTSPAVDYDATAGMKGTGSVTVYNLPADQTYSVTVRALNDCAGIPDASGAFAIVGSSTGKGTGGGGSYKLDAATGLTGRVKFAHVVAVSTVTKKVGKASVTTTTTKGSLLWTYKNVWRLKANINYSATDGSSPYGRISCTSGDFGATVVGTSFTCGRFSGAALLQRYDEDAAAWVASSYTNVTFVATVYDGGTKSVCSKNKCTTTDYPDWFGVTIKANNVPLGPSTSPTPVPTSLMRSLASPDGNGSLKAL